MSPGAASAMCWVDVVAALVSIVTGDADSEIYSLASWLLGGASAVLWFVFANWMFNVTSELRNKLAV